jgi:hypothetical protein
MGIGITLGVVVVGAGAGVWMLIPGFVSTTVVRGCPQ